MYDVDIDSCRFFHTLPYIEDIIIPNSIFMFHSLNALYFLFQEVSMKSVSNLKSIVTPLKILHNVPESNVINEKKCKKTNITKNVRFSYKENKKMTKRIRILPVNIL